MRAYGYCRGCSEELPSPKNWDTSSLLISLTRTGYAPECNHCGYENNSVLFDDVIEELANRIDKVED